MESVQNIHQKYMNNKKNMYKIFTYTLSEKGI